MLRGIIWQDPDTILDGIYTPRLRSLKRSPASRQPIANPSATSRQPVADQSHHISYQSPINRQEVANQSPTGRRFLLTVLAYQSEPGPQLGDWLPIDLQLKSGGFDCMVVALVAADFGHNAVADRLQSMCDRGFMTCPLFGAIPSWTKGVLNCQLEPNHTLVNSINVLFSSKIHLNTTFMGTQWPIARQ